MFKNSLILLVLSTISYTPIAAETWRGVIIEPENRCSLYDKKAQYPYSQSVEDEIVASTGELFMDHILAPILTGILIRT